MRARAREGGSSSARNAYLYNFSAVLSRFNEDKERDKNKTAYTGPQYSSSWLVFLYVLIF